MKRQGPESIIKKHICMWLSYEPQCMFWIQPSTGIWDVTRGMYRNNRSAFSKRGVADILGIWKSKPLAIEVKSKTGRLSEEQERFLEDFKKQGGIAIVARSVDDVRDALHGI